MDIRAIRFLAAAAGVCFIVGMAQAADIQSPMTPETKAFTAASGWKFSLAPYFWAAGISGNVAQFGLPSVHVSAGFSDIFDNLKFGGMAMGEARHGPYSLFGDIMYISIEGQSGTPRGLLATDVELKTETFSGLLGAGYSVSESDSARLDLVAGMRVWSVDSELSFSGGLLDDRSRSDGATWVDGLVGVRGSYSFTPEVYLTGWGLVGAGEADLDWDVAAAIGYRASDTISAVAGYRALGVDYSRDGFEFDAVQQGPILGVVMRF